MKLKHYGLLFASLGLLAACSNDNLDAPNGSVDENGEVGAVITLNVVEKTRTQTPLQGSENATDEESTIKEVLLILADETDTQQIVVAGEEEEENPGTWKFNFKDNDFRKLQGLPKTHVYVVCNLAAGVYNSLPSPQEATKPIQKIMSLTDDDDTYWDWDNKKFLMSNYEAVSKTIDVTKVKAGDYATTPLDFGTIKVQRTMARLDLAKGQPENKLGENAKDVKETGIKVVFTNVALVNISKTFYLYKEVGTTAGWTLFGEEKYDSSAEGDATKTNYVNDPKYNTGTYVPNFLVNVTKTLTPASMTTFDWSFDTTPIESDATKITYTKWRYVTPNTVTSAAEQKNGVSTGIVFKAEIQAANNGSLNVAANDGANLYVYEGKVVGDWTKLKELVAYPSGAWQESLAAIYTSLTNGKTTEADVISVLTSEANKKLGFTVYPKAADGKFYCYYYYWIRHNGFGTNSDQVMHPMEFGVVRNNIYKIAVTAVKGLGVPGNFEPDPDQDDDPVKDPEPTSAANITVSLEVQPWEVRTDNIEF